MIGRGGRRRGGRCAVLVAGPDGSGKSAIVDELAARAACAGVAFMRAHHRPMVVFRRSQGHGPVPEPHAQAARATVPALLKLAAVFVDTAAGWLGPLRGAAASGVLVVERGWFDMAVDPVRYRLPARLATVVRTLGRLLPRADLVVVLTGDPAVIHDRKPEIGVTEVERQVRAWRAAAPTAGRRSLVLDTTVSSPEASADEVWAAIRACRRAWVRVPLVTRRVGVRQVGPVDGAPAVYRPSRIRARAGYAVGRWAARVGLAPRAEAPPVDLDALTAELGLHEPPMQLVRSSAPGRLVVGVGVDEGASMVLKVGDLHDVGLRRECEVMVALGGQCAVRTPRVRWHGERDGRLIVATQHVRPSRPEAATVEEIAPVCTALVNGVGELGPLVHGDLTRWNVVVTPDGPVLLDWELADAARRPMHDLAHFVVQESALLRTRTPAGVLAVLCDRGSVGARHLTDVGEDWRDAPLFLGEYLVRWRPRGRAIRFHVELRRHLDRLPA